MMYPATLSCIASGSWGLGARYRVLRAVVEDLSYPHSFDSARYHHPSASQGGAMHTHKGQALCVCFMHECHLAQKSLCMKMSMYLAGMLASVHLMKTSCSTAMKLSQDTSTSLPDSVTYGRRRLEVSNPAGTAAPVGNLPRRARAIWELLLLLSLSTIVRLHVRM